MQILCAPADFAEKETIMTELVTAAAQAARRAGWPDCDPEALSPGARSLYLGKFNVSGSGSESLSRGHTPKPVIPDLNG